MNKEAKNVFEMLIKHLAYELNGDLSKITIEPELNEIFTLENNGHFFNIEEVKNLGKKVKDIFLRNLEEYDDEKNEIGKCEWSPNNGINKYFNNLIKKYIEAIDSLKNLYKEN